MLVRVVVVVVLWVPNLLKVESEQNSRNIPDVWNAIYLCLMLKLIAKQNFATNIFKKT